MTVRKWKDRLGGVRKSASSQALAVLPPVHPAMVCVLLLSTLMATGCERVALAFAVLTAPYHRQSEERGGSDLPPVSFSGNSTTEHITSEERKEALRLRESPDPAAVERAEFSAEIRGAFDEGDFDELERRAKLLASEKSRLADGAWKISVFYDAIDFRFNTTEAGFSADEKQHRRWRSEFPASPVQLTAYANMLVSYAWKARGNGTADTVSPSEFRLMQSRLAAAAEALKKAREVGGEDVGWHEASMSVGLGQGWKENDFDAVVESCLAKEQGFTPILVSRAHSLLPKWYGSPGDWERFAVSAADRAGPSGDEVYASLALHMYGEYADIFSEARIEWPRVKRGLAKLLSDYPRSMALKNHAAYMATLARDRDYAKKCFDELGDSYIARIWGKPERFVHFRGWATTGEW